MATKKTRYKARPGFERIPGRARYYKDLKSGEIITKRQYTKRSENVSSNEAKAKRLRLERLRTGQKQPMKRYNAIVEHYRDTHGAKVRIRGNSAEAQEFRRVYHDFVSTRSHNAPLNEMKKHYEAGQKLGVIKSTKEFGEGPGMSGPT